MANLQANLEATTGIISYRIYGTVDTPVGPVPFEKYGSIIPVTDDRLNYYFDQAKVPVECRQTLLDLAKRNWTPELIEKFSNPIED